MSGATSTTQIPVSTAVAAAKAAGHTAARGPCRTAVATAITVNSSTLTKLVTWWVTTVAVTEKNPSTTHAARWPPTSPSASRRATSSVAARNGSAIAPYTNSESKKAKCGLAA